MTRRLQTILLTVCLTLSAATAWAFWSAGSVTGGNGAAAVSSVNQGATPTASAAGNAVTVAWAPTTLTTGQAVNGYTVKRYSGSTAQTILTACTGAVTNTSCVENNVPTGIWTYSVTPLFANNWVGVESAKSSIVVVGNVAPVAVADSYSVAEDAVLTVGASGVLGNDSDPNSDPLSAILASGVANGALSFSANGGFTYTPNPNFNGSDSFSYKANDGTQNSNIVAVTLTVTAVNDAPLNSVPGPQQTPKNTNRVFSAATNNPISISDADAGGATVQVQLTATNGTVTLPVLTNLTFTVGDGTSDATMTFRGTIANINLRLNGAIFIPTNTFSGAATLQVVTSDLGNTGSGGTLTDTDTITINVNQLGIFTANQDIGAPGTAGSSTYSGGTNGTYTVKGGGADIWNTADQFQYLYRDLTGDGRLTAKVTSSTQTPLPINAGAKASVMFRESTAAGSMHATMDIMQTAGTEFLYRATTNGSTTWAGSAAPVAAPYWVRITRVGNVITGQYSPDGVTWTTQAAQTVAMNASIKVGLGVTAHDNAKLSIVTYDNVALTTPPTAVADAYTTNEDTTLVVPASGVLANDTDPESNALTAVLVSGTAGLTLNANGSFAYVPPANFSGAASFTYKANDGVFDSNTVTVNLTVNRNNQVPSFTKGANQSVSQGVGAQTVAGWATAISQGTGESGQLVDFVVANDNNPLFSVQPAVGADGTLTYTPAGTTGVATVSVRIHDNGGTANGGSDLSAVQTFTITITTDTTGPTGGSVDASGLVGTGSRYAASTTLSLNLATGTDPNGVAATGNLLKRATATLTSGGTANGTCGAFGSYTTVSGGTDPISPKSDTVSDQACYSYRYVVLDTLGNPTTYTSPDIKVDLTAPAAPSLAFSGFTNTYWTGSGTTVFYRSAATSGSFVATATATDAGSGIGSYSFPTLGTNWTSTPGALGVNTYSWSGAPAVPGAKSITATNNATGVSGSTSFTPTADDTAPSAGSVTPPDTTQAGTSVSVAFTTGTDGGSGLGTRLLQRQSATLTGTTCGSYGGWTTAATNPASSPFSDTVTGGFCYKYQYVVADNVGNLATATSANVVKVTTYLSAITGTGGLLSYWRLGEATTSSDSFSGSATGSDLSAHTGEIGATWTLWQNPGPTGLITSEGRLRRNNVGAGVQFLSSGIPASPDYLVEADIYVKSLAAADDIGITGRILVSDASDPGTTYGARYHEAAGVARWELRKNAGGTGTLLASFPQTLTVGSTYRIGLDMNGSTIRLFVDGVVRGSVTDTSITGAGRAGVRLGSSTATATQGDTVGLHLDNFRVSPPLADSTGTNNHGDYLGGPTLGNTGAIAGDADTAALFDGVNDYGTVARQIGDDFSIEFWFKSTQNYGSTCTQWWQGAGLVDAEFPGLANDFGVSLCQGKVIGGVGGTTEVSIVTSGTYNNGAWHHVVFTRTKTSGALALYVDGVAAGTATGSTVSLTSPANINFGRLATAIQYYAGSLDEISVYTSVLSGATVSAHYAAAQ